MQQFSKGKIMSSSKVFYLYSANIMVSLLMALNDAFTGGEVYPRSAWENLLPKSSYMCIFS